jgi:hypothetical protein
MDRKNKLELLSAIINLHPNFYFYPASICMLVGQNRGSLGKSMEVKGEQKVGVPSGIRGFHATKKWLFDA